MTSITFWTRIEPYTRLEDIEDGLQARLHDPLWLLARQWQTGEFQGRGRGHAGAGAGAAGADAADDLRRARGGREPFRTDVPLEALVEREPVRGDVRAAAEAGLTFLKMLTRAGVDGGDQDGVRRRVFAIPPAPAGEDAAGAR